MEHDEIVKRMMEATQTYMHNITRNIGFVAPEALPEHLAQVAWEVVNFCAETTREILDAVENK